MTYFATLFDYNYLSRGIVLYNSLKLHCTHFTLYILALDIQTERFFTENHFEDIVLISLHELEENDSQLFSIKPKRSLFEYYFTISPCFPLFLLTKYNLPHICTLDADIKFYSSPSLLFEYLKEYSIVITPHKFSKENSNLTSYGKFNVSFQIFKNDEVGYSCLNHWRDQCIDWCYDYVDGYKFADQGYLNNWPLVYKDSLKILDDDVSGIAPWNVNQYKMEFKKRMFFNNSKELIFYHFQGFNSFQDNIATGSFEKYNVKINFAIKKLYVDYWSDIKSTNQKFQLNSTLSNRNTFNKKVKDLILYQIPFFYNYINLYFSFDTRKIPGKVISIFKFF